MARAVLAHTLVAAHAVRVRELARLYGSLEDAVAAAGVDSDAARAAHRSLSARVVEWETADLEAERRDVVQLTADEREAMLRDVDWALPHAERWAEDLPPTAEERAVVDGLRRVRSTFPTSLARADVVRFRRSAERGKRMEASGTWFLLGNEARIMLGALEAAAAPIAPIDVAFDAEPGFRDTLFNALNACAICEPGAAGCVDLGLGASTAVPALLGATRDDLDQIYDRWLETQDASHLFAPYPYVPRGRFRGTSPTQLVCSYLSATGPIGWAAGDDVTALARDLRALTAEQSDVAAELRAAADRVDSAGRRGHALIGLIEYVPPQNEGWRRLLVANDPL